MENGRLRDYIGNDLRDLSRRRSILGQRWNHPWHSGDPSADGVEENSRRLRVISDYVPKVPRNGVRGHRNYELSVNATELPLSTEARSLVISEMLSRRRPECPGN